MPSDVVSRNPRVVEDTLPLAAITSAVYDKEDHPFEFTYLGFDELPEAAQKFLRHTTQLTNLQLSVNDPRPYFSKLVQVRQARQDRLGRTLEGVHRAIAARMMASNQPDFDPESPQRMEELTKILIPEWRSHLDDYVVEIDALVWFEMNVLKGTPLAATRAEFLKAREDDVQAMVAFALKRLQMTNDQLKREIRGEMLMARLMPSLGDSQGEGHISDRDSDASDSPCPSDSEAQWISV